jgi:hypothetical protein
VLNASRVVNAVLNGTVFGEEEAFLFSFIAPLPLWSLKGVLVLPRTVLALAFPAQS